jgi:hypothetical protein
LFGTAGVQTRLDVGFRLKKDYKDTGSILGSVVYDTTRTNLRPAEAATENHEPGLPGIGVSLYRLDSPQYNNGKCNSECLLASVGYTCLDEGNLNKGQDLRCSRFYIGQEGHSKPSPVVVWTSTDEKTGTIVVKEGQIAFDFNKKESPETLVAQVVTAEFKSPTNCVITDQDGNPIHFNAGQNVLPDPTPEGTPCVETPMLRNQVGGFAKVDGTFQFDDLEPGLYAIAIDIPMDLEGSQPAYKVRTENDINSYDSDQWQGNSCPNGECPVCPSNVTEDSCPMTTDQTSPIVPAMQNVMMPCAGAFLTVDDLDSLSPKNPSFADNGGSHLSAGSEVHSCDIKLVLVEPGINKRANFHLFTDVPIPSRWKGIVLNDRAPQANPDATLFTELQGVPGMPVGVRDYSGTKLTDAVTDVSLCCYMDYGSSHSLLFLMLLLFFYLIDSPTVILKYSSLPVGTT